MAPVAVLNEAVTARRAESMSSFAARHPILAGMIAALLHAPIVAAAAIVFYRVHLLVPGWVRAYFWSIPDVVGAAAASVFAPTATVWALLSVGAIALWRFRSNASVAILWLLVLSVPLQMFWQAIVVAGFYYGHHDRSGLEARFLARSIAALDSEPVLRAISNGTLLAIAVSAVAIGLAWLVARRLRRKGRWEMILPAPCQLGLLTRFAASHPVVTGGGRLALMEIVLFQVFALPGACFWSARSPGTMLAAQGVWLALAAMVVIIATIFVAMRYHQSWFALVEWLIVVGIVQVVLFLVGVGIALLFHRYYSGFPCPPYDKSYLDSRLLEVFTWLVACPEPRFSPCVPFVMVSLAAAALCWVAVRRWAGRRKSVDGTGSAK